MSAIAGILGRKSDASNRAAFERMLAAMHHRGPDGEGVWESADGSALLGHRLLRTLDATPQPVSDGRLTLACDGSIFSHASVNEVLREPELGALRGMFAIAQWDEPAKTLTLARDPLGQRPLYFVQNKAAGARWTLAFASEVRALLASGLLGKAKLDAAALASFVWNGFVLSPLTIVRSVFALLPGEWIRFNADGEIGRGHVWRMPDEAATKTSDESEMRRELRDAVKLSMRHDSSAAMGVLLSGGIDSSSVANLAQQQADRPIDTFCMAMEQSSLDESAAAREIARAIGSNHHEVTLTEQKFVDSLDAAIDALDQPTFDALNQFHICRSLRDAGMKIALGGIGGDAIFGGDKTFAQLPKARSIARKTRIVPLFARVAAAKLVATIASGKHSQQRWAKLVDVVKADGDLLKLYQLTYALFRSDFYDELLAAKRRATAYGLPAPTEDWLRGEIRNHSAVEVAGILETRCFVGERLLRDADTVSSALSFELRSPLADPRVIEQLSRLDASRKFAPVGVKPMLRHHGLHGLDPKLFDRPKSGFVLPFDLWIRRNLGDAMDQWMRDPKAAADAGLNGPAVVQLWDAFQRGEKGIYWTRVWAIYVLIRWCHRHGVLV